MGLPWKNRKWKWKLQLCARVKTRCSEQHALDNGVYSTGVNRRWTELKGAHVVARRLSMSHAVL